jgi:CBS domain containing-hemolysin-like protein
VIALLLVAVLLLVLINGFFVAAEFALVRSGARGWRSSRRRARARPGALDLLDDLNQYLSACQFGITLASLGIGFLGEPAIADLVEPIFGEGPAAHVVAIAIAYVIVTAIHITIGEQVPKIYSIVKAESTAMLVAGPLRASPRHAPVHLRAQRRLQHAACARPDRPDAAMEEGATPEELRVLIAQGRAGGQLDPGESGMLEGVFHLHEQEARQIMTPIPAVVTVDTSEDVETALRRCISSGHTACSSRRTTPRTACAASSTTTRWPGAHDDGPEASIEPLVKDAPIVPETKPLDDLLAELQRSRISMAVVVDEYGRVAGIVTVEDIVEEVVGEIDDETDPTGGEIRKLANGDWFVRGHVAVTDLSDHGLELPMDTDAYNSVGGFVFAELGRLPRRGDTVRTDGYAIRVESVRENRIEAVRIRERPPEPAVRGEADAD